jgi:hypothetical protein
MITKPAPAISVSNFRDGVYTLNGVETTVEALWEQDLALSNITWNPTTDITPGIGIFKAAAPLPFSMGPAATALHKAQLPLTSGITIVLEGQLSKTDDNFNFSVWLHNSTYSHFQFGEAISDHNVIVVKDKFGNSPGPTQLWKPPGQPGNADPHTLAFTLANEHLAVAVDGGPIFASTSTVDQSSLDRLHIWSWVNAWTDSPETGTVTIVRCEIYPQLDDHILPFLSRRA